ncbi:MAG: glutaminase A [Tissierellales bacterium]|nr:glutaminase A [Tissierellales bacterium]MBN2826837.1 glutaminase A [Tissierellales bacterium]
MKEFLEETVHSSKYWVMEGHIASYIPRLATANKKHVGIGVYTVDNQYHSAGDTNIKFSIQSVCKVFSLICALKDSGLEKLLMKVDVEPSGDRFNSLVKLETMQNHRPLNPFINAGAIATIGMIRARNAEERFNKVLQILRDMTNNDNLTYNQEVYESEKETGDTNKAIAYYLKGAGILEENVDDILDTYFKICSMEAGIEDMARAAAVIANDGSIPWNGNQLISKEDTKIVRAIMATSGLYDGSGEFSVKVGIPAKSGVGGCIIGAAPNKMGIATFGPSLNEKGNSIAGIRMFQSLSKEYQLSVF